MNIKAFWNRVKLQIKSRTVTQADAAKACGVLPDTFRRWMSMGRVPPLNNSYMLARYLGVSLEYLITGRSSDNVSAISEEIFALIKKTAAKRQRPGSAKCADREEPQWEP